MPKITPFLWFDGAAEKAAKYYVSIFPNSRIRTVTRYGEGGPGPLSRKAHFGFSADCARAAAARISSGGGRTL